MLSSCITLCPAPTWEVTWGEASTCSGSGDWLSHFIPTKVKTLCAKTKPKPKQQPKTDLRTCRGMINLSYFGFLPSNQSHQSKLNTGILVHAWRAAFYCSESQLSHPSVFVQSKHIQSVRTDDSLMWLRCNCGLVVDYCFDWWATRH